MILSQLEDNCRLLHCPAPDAPQGGPGHPHLRGQPRPPLTPEALTYIGPSLCDLPAPSYLPPHTLYEGDPQHRTLETDSQEALPREQQPQLPWTLPCPGTLPRAAQPPSRVPGGSSIWRGLWPVSRTNPSLCLAPNSNARGRLSLLYGLGHPAWIRQPHSPKPNLGRSGPQGGSKEHFTVGH